MTRRRVYVRGLGAISALGASWNATRDALAAGRCAIGPVRSFDASAFPCKVAAAIDGVERSGDRRVTLAMAALRDALSVAGADAIDVPSSRLGVFLGAESGRAPFETLLALTRAAGGGSEFSHARFGSEARALSADFDSAVTSPATVSAALAQECNAGGPVVTLSLACASGASAIAEAARAIRLGVCDAALCGGVGADVDPLMLAGFGHLGALSERGVSCPFDARRDGFVVGEGAALVVLSSARGSATTEIAGEGRTLDAHHLTAPDPSGSGAERAMRAALGAAGGGRVGYVQAHGTSTPLNDAIEAQALRTVFGDALQDASVSSVKGALGHWIAGAGALGFACAHAAVAGGLLLPTANLLRPGADCALPHVMHEAMHRPTELALVNAFAFGGANCSLVLRRCA